MTGERRRVGPRRWDICCRVVDNLGDAGVLWRLARQLAQEHALSVRLFIDRPDVLARLVPDVGHAACVDGVQVCRLDDAGSADALIGDAADVVVAGFHARLPGESRRRLQDSRAVLIQLEYLSAETWVEGCHGLPSPGADGVVEHYFYPGFSDATGGLLREHDLIPRRDAFRADPGTARRHLAGLGVHREPGALLASLFCYPQAPLEAMARQLSHAGPVLQLIAPVSAAPDEPVMDTDALLRLSDGHLRLVRVPFQSQRDYDLLLWSCDLNIVRGEDSWIRAVWAGRPLLWQAYPQSDDARRDKVDAFIGRLVGPGGCALGDAIRWWNGLTSDDGVPQPANDGMPMATLLASMPEATRTVCRLVRTLIDGTAPTDLAARLVAFAEARRTPFRL